MRLCPAPPGPLQHRPLPPLHLRPPHRGFGGQSRVQQHPVQPAGGGEGARSGAPHRGAPGGAALPPLRAGGDGLSHPPDALGRRGPDRLLHLPPLPVSGEGGFMMGYLPPAVGYLPHLWGICPPIWVIKAPRFLFKAALGGVSVVPPPQTAPSAPIYPPKTAPEPLTAPPAYICPQNYALSPYFPPATAPSGLIFPTKLSLQPVCPPSPCLSP